MKQRWPRRLLLVILCVLLCCSLIFSASGSSSVYLMAVNDNVFDMTADNMPRVVGNVLYIPYTMLSPQVTGINLGVQVQYNSSRGILTVGDANKTVTFNTRRNTAHDSLGNALSVRVLVRNTMAYIPVDWLCNYFIRLNYSLIRTRHGPLIRLTNSKVVLDDAAFADAADSILEDNLIRYQNSLLTPSPSPAPSPTPTPTPTPTVYLSSYFPLLELYSP